MKPVIIIAIAVACSVGAVLGVFTINEMVQEQKAILEDQRLIEKQNAILKNDRLIEKQNAILEDQRLIEKQNAILEDQRLIEKQNAILKDQRLIEKQNAILEAQRIQKEVLEREVFEIDSMCKHLAGSGSNINFVIVPCRFEESDSGQVNEIVSDIVEDFKNTEPYKSNLDKFSIYFAEDYENTFKLDSDNVWTCSEDRKLEEVTKKCAYENYVMISLGNGPTKATSRNGIASVPISEEYQYSDPGFLALHESGHVLGLGQHSCYDPDGPLVNRDLSENISRITGRDYVDNCGVTQISENQPCQEWQTEEYLRWVLPGDPKFGCYDICGNFENYFRPWENGEVGIMCIATPDDIGYTPVERKMLYDRLVEGPYPIFYKKHT